MAARGPENPRVRVAALILIDERVVLVRHRAGSAVYHLLPGGGVDYRETLEDALIREVAEETGLRVTIGRPVLISDTIDPEGPRHVVNITFTAQVEPGSRIGQSSDRRVEGVELVAPEQLTGMDLRPPHASALQRIVANPSSAPAAYLGSLFTPGP